jgi:hypothetical protein
VILVNIKRFFIILFSILCVLTIISLRYFSSNNLIKEVDSKNSLENDNSLKGELSLMEAYQLALKEAKSYNKDAQLVLVTSVDDDEKELAGSTGTRKKWNLVFANIPAEETLLVSIDNASITKTSTSKEKTMESNVINIDLMKIDSKYVIEKAKKDLDLKPGINWAKGYHFSIMNNGKQTFMTVTGLNSENQFTQVFYDIKTGECMGSKAQQK